MTNQFSVFLPSLLLLSANFIAFSQNPEPHFLEACFFCRKSLGYNTDIFMYRGNTPFCSKECRQEQIEMEEAKEKNWRSSPASTKAPRKSAANKKTVRTGTVAVV